ncbi:hypothetical protein D9619_013275 [Psilocybe cf. subviscida]|uniref:Uncharacterized protein n=1 Tax=Psilocybe cf. subviscida TaxID=2480587 RepID=A0A8H5BRY3_9AGAR|nr:hypothetical protein D9619_013275 [Psilocybe cf. subviscida]
MQNVKEAWKRVKAIISKGHQYDQRSYINTTVRFATINGKDDPENAKAGNAIHGHDYTDAQFMEIDRQYNDDVLSTSRHINCLSLHFLTQRTGPGAKYKGLGWRDLFAERTWMDKMPWLVMDNISELAEKTAMNEDCMFRVWYCPPGLIHVEVDDEGTWTVQDILTLPKWMIIG